MLEKNNTTKLEKTVSDMFYAPTLFFGGLAMGMCVGHGSENYNHVENAISTVIAPLTAFPLFDKFAGRDNYDIAKRTVCISTGFFAGQYLIQTINQVI